jgi:hypothetical protein
MKLVMNAAVPTAYDMIGCPWKLGLHWSCQAVIHTDPMGERYEQECGQIREEA